MTILTPNPKQSLTWGRGARVWTAARGWIYWERPGSTVQELSGPSLDRQLEKSQPGKKK